MKGIEEPKHRVHIWGNHYYIFNQNKRPMGKDKMAQGRNGRPGLIFGLFVTNPDMGRYEYRHRKIDMPLFDGTNPNGWILQA